MSLISRTLQDTIKYTCIIVNLRFSSFCFNIFYTFALLNNAFLSEETVIRVELLRLSLILKTNNSNKNSVHTFLKSLTVLTAYTDLGDVFDNS